MTVTDRVETVYNLEIEEDHTYFVGCDEWGFSLWAHNAACTADEVRSVFEVAGKKVDSTTASKIGNAIRKDRFDTVTKLLEPLGVKAIGQEFLRNVEVYRALRETGMTHAEVVQYYQTLGEVQLFRGTTEGYPGNAALQAIGISPASIDPVIATVFAVQSRTLGKNAQVQFGRQSAMVDTLEVGNVLRVTEREVAVPLTPAAFEAIAPHRIPVDHARAILAEPAIGVDVPAGFARGDDRAFLLTYEATGNRLTPSHIQYFVQRATGVR